MKNALKLIVDNLSSLEGNFKSLTSKEVLVGVPEEKTARQNTKEPNNAMLAYVHDNGSPAQNIPARPFMNPGILRAKEPIAAIFKRGATRCLDGDKAALTKTLNEAGLTAQASIRAVINEGIPPALKSGTLKARIRARRGAKGAAAELERRRLGLAEGVDLAKPLVNTGQLRNSINYVIRDN